MTAGCAAPTRPEVGSIHLLGSSSRRRRRYRDPHESSGCFRAIGPSTRPASTQCLQVIEPTFNESEPFRATPTLYLLLADPGILPAFEFFGVNECHWLAFGRVLAPETIDMLIDARGEIPAAPDIERVVNATQDVHGRHGSRMRDFVRSCLAARNVGDNRPDGVGRKVSMTAGCAAPTRPEGWLDSFPRVE